jgi:hypothetical protein
MELERATRDGPRDEGFLKTDQPVTPPLKSLFTTSSTSERSAPGTRGESDVVVLQITVPVTDCDVDPCVPS